MIPRNTGIFWNVGGSAHQDCRALHIVKATDWRRVGLLEWRNTPKAHGKSPAELVYGCQMRSVVPSLERNLSPPWKANIEKKVAELQKKSERYYNIGAKDLKELSVGDRVRIQDHNSKRWIEKGVIARKGQNRDYRVELPNGRLRWRNRCSFA